MNIKFNKLVVENRFADSFEKWTNNNEIEFSNKGVAIVYAPNGVGKSSLAKALKNDKDTECEYEYNGVTYNKSSKDIPMFVIDDFFFRNIATRENERLSDYILGSQIKKEMELKEKLDSILIRIRETLINYLKDEYGIKSKDSNISQYIENQLLKKLINDLANNRNKGKDYKGKDIIDIVKSIKVDKEIEIENNKFNYIKSNIENSESIIIDILNFDISKMNKITEFNKLDIDNDALNILNKHKNLTKCIFEESHILPQGLKEKIEENKNSIIGQLDDNQKKVVEKIMNVEDNPFQFKEIFNNAFERGDSSEIVKVIDEIKSIIATIINRIIKKIIDVVEDNKLEVVYKEFKDLVESKIELSEDDELALQEMINSCIGKQTTFTRDENKNIIFSIEGAEVIGKERRDLPLSTGEQNFISLYFELLAAKNSSKEIIVIDDPISSFDSIYKNKIIYAIVRVLVSNKKLIVLTHNIDTIKLMNHQYQKCFNLYLLNNEQDGENGFTPVKQRNNNRDDLKDMDLMLEIQKVIETLKDTKFINNVKQKELFLLSMIPFMRSYCNILGDEVHYKQLCKLMHGYESGKVNINEVYKEIFTIDVLQRDYEVDVDDIINVSIVDEIIDKNLYPILNRTMYHNLNYLVLRLKVEKVLYQKNPTAVNWGDNPKLHKIIDKVLDNDSKNRNILISKKTLLNEFNHFEYDMCLFLPSLDISDKKLIEESVKINEVCAEISGI